MPTPEYTRDIPGWTGRAVPNGQEVARAEFINRPVLDPEAAKRGEEKYIDRIITVIYMPGDPKYVHEHKTTEYDKKRFPHAWQNFLNQGGGNVTVGTPIERWKELNETQIRNLKAMNLDTVEEISQMTDSICMQMMGGRTLRDKARAFIDANRSGLAASQYAAESTQLKMQMEAMQEQLASMRGDIANVQTLKAENESLKVMLDDAHRRIEDILPDVPKKRGRPKKVREPSVLEDAE